MLLMYFTACTSALRSIPTLQNLRQQGSRSVNNSALELRGGGAGFMASSSLQKAVDFGVLVGIGVAMRGKMDAKMTQGVQAILMQALVPSVVFSSLSRISLDAGMTPILMGGTGLVLSQIAVAHLVARLFIRDQDDDLGHVGRRTVSLQLGSMAPALTVFAFVREFVSVEWAGLSALLQVPNYFYGLVLMPQFLLFRGAQGKDGTRDSARASPSKKPWSRLVSGGGITTRRVIPGLQPGIVSSLAALALDPFNLAIAGGLVCAGTGCSMESLGFVGRALNTLSSAQTPILCLLIGLKLKLAGASFFPLLFARHGLLMLLMAASLKVFQINSNDARLTLTLSSQASVSIISFGQIARTHAPGYDTELAFDMIGPSLTFSIILNSIICILGHHFVDALPLVGAGFLAVAAATSTQATCQAR